MNEKGFTLVELIIVIVIVGILSIVAVPIYTGYVQKAKWAEGKALAASIITAQRVYYSENGRWYESGDWADEDKVLSSDARENKFFRKIKTGISDKYENVVCAAVFYEKEDIILYEFWPADMDRPASYPKWLVADSAGKHIAEEW